MNHILERIVVAGSCLLLLCVGCGGTPANPETRRASARTLIDQFQSTLQAELKAALDAGGPVAAIEICSERAPRVAADLAKEGDLRIRRIGTRVRNKATNVPTEAERAILDRFAALPEDARQGAFEEAGTDDAWSYYAPIFAAKPACLLCHGDAVAEPVREALAARYPDDEATGYQLGDLRGAFVVEPK